MISRATLISTLGAEPQVVTLAFDLLRQQGHQIEEIIVLHTAADVNPSKDALNRLKEAIQTLKAEYPKLWYRPVELCDDNQQPIADIGTQAALTATFRTFFRVALSVKNRHEALHICIAGGRKTMAVYGMMTAQLLFDEGDHLWHLLSPREMQDEKRMRLREDDTAELVQIPIIRASSLPTNVLMDEIDDPDKAVALLEGRRAAELSTFVERILTGRERELLQMMVLSPEKTYKQWAEAMGVTNNTLKKHVESVYGKTADYFALEKVKKATLPRIFATYRW